MKHTTLLVALAALLLLPAAAHARCAGPRAFFSPPSGTLTKRSRVFLFLFKSRGHAEFRVSASGARVRTRRLASASPTIDVVRVDIEAPSSRRVTLRASSWAKGYRRYARHVVARYRVGRGHRPPRGVSPQWGKQKASAFSWTCSSEKGFFIDVFPRAAAYRVVVDAQSAKGRRVVYLPPSMDLFWAYGGAPRLPKKATLFFGRKNCFGPTVAFAAKSSQVIAQPLFSDGSDGKKTPPLALGSTATLRPRRGLRAR